MKTIRYSITILFLLLIITTIGNLINSTLALFFDKHILFFQESKSPSLSTQVVFMVKALALLVFVYAVFMLIKNLKLFSKGDFFHLRLIGTYSKAGILFLFSGTLGLVVSIISRFFVVKYGDIHNQMYLNIDSKGLYILLMILGLFFILFAKILTRGNEIKQENDLTI